jgi:hypothetical protein
MSIKLLFQLTIYEILLISMAFILHFVHYGEVYLVLLCPLACTIMGLIIWVSNRIAWVNRFACFDSVLVSNKMIIGVCTIIFAFINDFLNTNIIGMSSMFVFCLLIVAGSLSIICARDTFFISDLLLSLLYVALGKSVHPYSMTTWMFVFIAAFYLFAMYLSHLGKREKFLLHFKPIKYMKNNVLDEKIGLLSEFRHIFSEEYNRIIAISYINSRSLYVYFVDEGENLYIRHIRTDGSICYVGNYSSISKLNFFKRNSMYMELSKNQKKNVVSDIMNLLEEDKNFTACTVFANKRCKGYVRTRMRPIGDTPRYEGV